MSKFQELVYLNQEDRKVTYEYVSRIVLFVSVIRQNLVEYLECNPQDVQFLGQEDRVGHAHGNATVDEEGYLNFRILITLSRESFNINECGKDFFDKGLAPLSGIILNVGIWELEGNYKVKAPSIKEGNLETKVFSMKQEDGSHWEIFLESSFQAIKNIAGQDLRTRLELLASRDSQETVEDHNSDRAYGYLSVPF